ncbi:MAG: ferrous iron transporter B [Bacteriovoracaceae bacterium]|nr:ferrous iron transporter B [Bacteriovoracaceae bacterium]
MKKKFFLIGPPNSGKTALFNALTGMHFKSTNYPGVTVEQRTGKLKNYPDMELTDLPGLYSLNGQGIDEIITRDHILQNQQSKWINKNSDISTTGYDGIILILDSTRLNKSLYLALELKSLNLPILLALNMHDVATSRGQLVDLTRLAEFWKDGIWQGCAFRDDDIRELEQRIQEFNPKRITPLPFIKNQQDLEKILLPLNNADSIAEFFLNSDKMVNAILLKKISPDNISQRLDSILTHPIWGSCVLVVLLAIIFETLFKLSAPLQDGISSSFDWLSALLKSHYPPSDFINFLTEGVIAGVGSVVVFLPQIVLLFGMIILLEDSGYLSRVAFLCDSLFKRFGLPGTAVIPLLSGHACAIPAMMSARSMNQHSDRLTTILITPLMVCSARIPVFSLLIATLIPRDLYWGPLSYQGLTMLGLYLLGLITALITALLLKRVAFKSSARNLLMELPSYRTPRLKNLWVGLKNRSSAFLKKAGTIIFSLSLVLWFLSYYPRPALENGSAAASTENSYASKMGKSLAPLFAPLGFDWKMTAALIPSFAAREVMVSALATTFAIDDVESETGLTGLQTKIRETYPLSTIWALLLWFVFAPQCISTFAVMRRETNSWKWPIIVIAYTGGLAYLSAWMAKSFF